MHSSERCLVGKAMSRPVKCNSHAFIKMSVSTIILPCFLADACIYMRMWKPLQGQYPESTFCKTVHLCYRVVVVSVCLSVLSVFNVRVLWPNGWMDQDETWQAGRPRPWPHCIRWRSSSPSPKGAEPHNFWPMSVVPKRLDGSRCHLVRRLALAQATSC